MSNRKPIAKAAEKPKVARLSEIDAEEVSPVPAGANKKKWAFRKEDRAGVLAGIYAATAALDKLSDAEIPVYAKALIDKIAALAGLDLGAGGPQVVKVVVDLSTLTAALDAGMERAVAKIAVAKNDGREAMEKAANDAAALREQGAKIEKDFGALVNRVAKLESQPMGGDRGDDDPVVSDTKSGAWPHDLADAARRQRT